ncbi:MAG: hypothetical protein OEZ36_12760 [Spirochaetota bacterium]|nr:hypothetical protein [Spirochaetota bacterium]
MKMQGLSFENIPPIHIPFRFYIVAPLFGLLAAILLFVGNPDHYGTRLSPLLLSVTHLFTLGFMLMIMFGSLFQMLPVLSGESIPDARFVSTAVFSFLSLGLILLVISFFFSQRQLLYFAVLSLVVAFLTFLISLSSVLIKKIGGKESIFTMRLSVISLFITIFIGLYRAMSYVYPMPFTYLTDLNFHVGWGIFGWCLLLVMGVSYQVIPMFHVTPSYPSRLTRIVPSSIFIILIFLSFIQIKAAETGLVILLSFLIAGYAIYSLYLFTKRKRKVPDIIISFWRLAMISLIMTVAVYMGNRFLGDVVELPVLWDSTSILIGLFMIFGFVSTVIIGMLQKIVPFLIYHHLQRLCITDFEALKTLPHMHMIISSRRSRWQLYIHVASLIMLVSAVLYRPLLKPAAIILALDFIWLGISIIRATRLYMLKKKEIMAMKESML